MVQAGPSIDYDGNMDEGRKPDQNWGATVQSAVREFVASIGESSKQLASAAEKLAGDSLHVIDDVTDRARESASASAANASSASEAVAEARRIAEDVRRASDEAAERARTEARGAVEEAVARAEQAVQAAERVKSDIEQKLQEALAHMESTLNAANEAATRAEAAADQARTTGDEAVQRTQSVVADVKAAADDAVQRSQTVVAEVQSAVEEARRQTGGIVAEARAAADEAVKNSQGIAAIVRSTGEESTRQSRAVVGEVQAAGEQAAQRVQAVVEEARAAGTEAVRQAQAAVEEARVAGVGMQTGFDQHVEEAARRIEEISAQAGVDIDARVRQAVEGVTATAQSAAGRAEIAAGSVDRLRSEIEQRYADAIGRYDRDLAASEEAATRALHAAEQAQSQANRAIESTEPAISGSASMILERLEADYQLLTRLVQELHSRISGLDLAPQRAQPVSVDSAPPPAMEAVAADEEPLIAEAPTTAHGPSWQAAVHEMQAVTDSGLDVERPQAEAPEEGTRPAPSEEASSGPDEGIGHDEDLQAPDEGTTRPSAAVPDFAARRALEVAASSAEPSEAAPSPKASRPPDEGTGHDEDHPHPVAPDGGTHTPAAEAHDVTPLRAVEVAAVFEGQLGGRVLVAVSPVPDFDRLLSLDGALGRMRDVRNVTLADYAREEVTFRVELDTPMSVDEFTQRLADAAGRHIEVVSAGQDSIALRLVA